MKGGAEDRLEKALQELHLKLPVNTQLKIYPR